MSNRNSSLFNKRTQLQSRRIQGIYKSLSIEEESYTFESLVSDLFNIQNTLEHLHFTTKVEPIHRALGEAYDETLKLKDEIIEHIIGIRNGEPYNYLLLPSSLSNTSSVEEIANRLCLVGQEIQSFAKQNNYSSVENLSQELYGVGAKLKYKLSLSQESLQKSNYWNDLMKNEDFFWYCTNKNLEDCDSGELENLSEEEKDRLMKTWEEGGKDKFNSPYPTKKNQLDLTKSEGYTPTYDSFREKQYAKIASLYKGELSDDEKEKATSLEKANSGKKYIKKYIGAGGKWIYVYENKDQDKNWDKHQEIESEIRDLYQERKQVFQDQENDTEHIEEVAITGGAKLAQEYGQELNDIEDKIREYKEQQTRINIDPYIHVQSDEFVPAALLKDSNFQKSEEDIKKGGVGSGRKKVKYEDLGEHFKGEDSRHVRGMRTGESTIATGKDGHDYEVYHLGGKASTKLSEKDGREYEINRVQKSQESSLEKSESSSNTIGTTESGKSVYSDKSAEDYSGFTKQDHEDAASLHHNKAMECSSVEDINRHLNIKHDHMERGLFDILDNQKIQKSELELSFDLLETPFEVNLEKGGETDLEKSKMGFPIGTVHNGYKKVKNGIWKKVSQFGSTKQEHLNTAKEFGETHDAGSDLGNGYTAGSAIDYHLEQASSVDDEDYTDSQVGIKTPFKSGDRVVATDDQGNSQIGIVSVQLTKDSYLVELDDKKSIFRDGQLQSSHGSLTIGSEAYGSFKDLPHSKLLELKELADLVTTKIVEGENISEEEQYIFDHHADIEVELAKTQKML